MQENLNELQHFGIKGMKWGVRRSTNNPTSRRQVAKRTRSDYLDDKGPKRFGFLNAANSAARTYYRQQRTNSFKTYKKQSNKLDLKIARLTDAQIKNGRYRVARARNIKRKTLSSIAGSAVGIGLISSGAGLIGVPVGLAVGTATNFASGGHYYAQQSRAYGKVRAKYQNQNRVTNRNRG